MAYSVLDQNLPVDKDNWVVAILRKPYGRSPEHAFLIVEGENKEGKIVLIRYDLVVDENSEKKGKAAIVIGSKIPVESNNAFDHLKGNILRDDEVYAFTWNISKVQAKELHKDILKDQENPPNYQISGDQSFIAKSTSHTGHNCFTWAREKLYNLNDPRIKLPEKWSDFIVAKTSLHITGKEEPKSGCILM